MTLKKTLHWFSDVVAFLIVSFPVATTILERQLGTREDVFLFWRNVLSLAPGLPGMLLRSGYYRWTLDQCATTARIAASVSIAHRETRIGNRVVITDFTSIGRCHIGDDTGIGSGCHIISGKREHAVDERGLDLSKPMRGSLLHIGSRVWIGDGCIIMADVGDGAIVGAGSVVTKSVPSNAVVAGNPAHVLVPRPQHESGANS